MREQRGERRRAAADPSRTRWRRRSRRRTARGDVHAARRRLHAVGVVDEAEVELGLGAQAQLAQRREVRGVDARRAATGMCTQLSGRPRLAASAFAISTRRPASAGSVQCGACRRRSRSGSRARRRAGRAGRARISRSRMPPLTSGNQPGRTPSSMPNSKFVSHCTASWSCGIASRIALELVEHRAPRRAARRGLVLGRDEGADRARAASGRQTWKRQPRGTTPSRLSRANAR